MKTANKLQGILTTGIGSLPHHNADSALEFSFRSDIPFLPQIPIRNSWEFMLPQALEGLPGISPGAGGAALLDFTTWSHKAKAFDDKLANATSSDRYDEFEPTPHSNSCWKPFLFELGERQTKFAKIQIAGPFTARWAIQLSEGTPSEALTQLDRQVFKLILARSLSMVDRLRSMNVTPLVFIDEPGLYALAPENPRSHAALQEVKVLVESLKRRGAQVGLHCCSDPDWKAVFSLGMDVISFDGERSIKSLFTHADSALQFMRNGGTFSIGIIPTLLDSSHLSEGGTQEILDAGILFSRVLSQVEAAIGSALRPTHDKVGMETDGTFLSFLEALKNRLILTPSCGLALHSVSDAERVQSLLQECRRIAPLALGLNSLLGSTEAH